MPSRAAASPSPAQTRRLARLPSRRCRASRRSWVIDRPSARWFGLVDLEPGDRVWSCGQPSSWSMRQVLSAASPVSSVRHGQCQRRSLPRGDGPGLARAAVTVTADLLAAAATHRLSPQTRHSDRCRRVPMLYGTRRGHNPKLLVPDHARDYGSLLISIPGAHRRANERKDMAREWRRGRIGALPGRGGWGSWRSRSGSVGRWRVRGVRRWRRRRTTVASRSGRSGGRRDEMYLSYEEMTAGAAC
jgi:hypothetical protein